MMFGSRLEICIGFSRCAIGGTEKEQPEEKCMVAFQSVQELGSYTGMGMGG